MKRKGFTLVELLAVIVILAAIQVTVDIMNQYFNHQTYLGECSVVSVNGAFNNVATMLVNTVTLQGYVCPSTTYGYAIVISYYQGLVQFRLTNCVWTLVP